MRGDGEAMHRDPLEGRTAPKLERVGADCPVFPTFRSCGGARRCAMGWPSLVVRCPRAHRDGQACAKSRVPSGGRWFGGRTGGRSGGRAAGRSDGRAIGRTVGRSGGTGRGSGGRAVGWAVGWAVGRVPVGPWWRLLCHENRRCANALVRARFGRRSRSDPRARSQGSFCSSGRPAAASVICLFVPLMCRPRAALLPPTCRPLAARAAHVPAADPPMRYQVCESSCLANFGPHRASIGPISSAFGRIWPTLISKEPDRLGQNWRRSARCVVQS